MIYIGIDPGKTGGIASLDNEGRVTSASVFTSFKQLYYKYFLDQDPANFFVALEKVHAHPKQGVVSVFNFGANFGGWKTMLEINSIPFIEVPPQTWMKKILGSFPKGESKKRAYDYTKQRFPSLVINKSDDGMIDAISLAVFARFMHMNQV